MKCTQCGEEIDDAKVCPVCGKKIMPRTPTLRADEFNPTAVSQESTGVKIFNRCINGVIELTVASGESVSASTGYLINSEGYAITNSHCVHENGNRIGFCFANIAGEDVMANVIAVGTDDEFGTIHDLAIIKLDSVPKNATPLCFAASDDISIGEQIYIIGNSLGDGNCITSGIISDKNRNNEFMYDGATNPGNSGGPVINTSGCVVATNVAHRSPNQSGVSRPQGMNYGIPCSYVKQMLSENGIRYSVKK